MDAATTQRIDTVVSQTQYDDAWTMMIIMWQVDNTCKHNIQCTQHVSESAMSCNGNTHNDPSTHVCLCCAGTVHMVGCTW